MDSNLQSKPTAAADVDRQLPAALSGPDDERRLAVTRLIEQFGGMLYAVALRVCRGPEDAEDLVQEVFLIALRSWGQLEKQSNAQAWLYTIAVRACQRRHRPRAGEPRHVASLEALLPFDEAFVPVLPERGADGLTEQVRRESLNALQEAIAALPTEFRMPLVLKDIVGLTLADVARALDVNEGTLKSRLHRSRLHLRKAILFALPQREAGSPAYPFQVCLDLIHAKQDALDRGAPFPVDDSVICDRCRSFFDSMDLLQMLCRHTGSEELPAAVRARVVRSIAATG